jgi:large subunit ribosomal protein L1
MAKEGKKLVAIRKEVNLQNSYDIDEAVSLVKKNAYVKFDETVDMAFWLSVDPRHADQMVRGSVALPNGLGKKVRVLVFASGEKEKEAKDAGADFYGGDDLIAKVQDGWLDFDKAVATPDMMGKVSKLGRILGPRGLMPNPKTNTVTFDVTDAVGSLKAGRVDFKVDKAGVIHAPIGKVSFEENALVENAMALIETLVRLKPSSAKGRYMKSITISSTMGVGVKIDPIKVTNRLKS